MSGTEPKPAPPPPGASRDQWREWRRRQRLHHFGRGGWTWFWGVALIIIGGYYLLRNLGLLSWVRDDVLWPLLLIAFGAFLLIGRATRQP